MTRKLTRLAVISALVLGGALSGAPAYADHCDDGEGDAQAGILCDIADCTEHWIVNPLDVDGWVGCLFGPFIPES